MKNTLLTMIGLLSILIAKAQISLASAGTEYNYTSTDWMGLPFLYTSLVSQGDTIVDGIAHRKLLKIEKEKASDTRYFSTTLVRQSNDSIFVDKIFMYYLGAKKGDTTVIDNRHYLILDSTGYMQIFGGRRKVFHFRQGATYCPQPSQPLYFKKVTFVENYGPIDGYISLQQVESCLTGVFNRQRFTCGKFMGAEYITSDYTSAYCMPLEVAGRKINNVVEIFPNPSRSLISINSNFKFREVEVYNSMGIKVSKKSNNLFGTFLEIDVFELPSGIYYVKIKGESELIKPFLKL